MSSITINKVNEFINKSYGEYVVRDDWKHHRSEKYYQYRKNWFELPKNMIVSDFPTHLDIEVTSFCNLACPFCPRTIQIKNRTFPSVKHIELSLYKKIIMEGAEKGLSSVKLNYLGEPLMHPDIIEIIRFTKEQGIEEVMFNSNGVLLTEEMSLKLLEAGLDSLFISFDSAYKDRYEECRIGATYEEVLNNVKRFCDIKNSDDRFKHVQIRVSKVVFPDETETDLKKYIELWEDKVDAIGFASLRDETVDHIFDYDSTLRCDQPWQRIFVRQDGVTFPCCADNMNKYQLGNANEQTITEMWHGHKETKLREAHANGRYNEIDICKNCTYLCSSKIKVDKIGVK